MQREEKILALFEKSKSLPFRKIKRKFPKISECMLRYDLAQLKKKGLLKIKGKGRAIIWEKLKSNFIKLDRERLDNIFRL